MEITGPILITVTLLQSMHGALPAELGPHSFGVNKKSTTHFCVVLSGLVEITGPIQITVTLLQTMHGALPAELGPHSLGVIKKSTTHFCVVLSVLVEITGIEPVTSCMPCKRSPS